jgi:hypothetical protein
VKIDYILSSPERLIRASAASLGGGIYQLSLILLPESLRRSRFYNATVARTLRIAIELVGGVPGVFPLEEMSARRLAARKAAGSAVEVASFAAVGWSPVWLLAAAADVVGGTQAYLRLLVEDLQRDGVLPPDAQIDSVQQLLGLLEGTLGQAADTVDMPPLNLEDMRDSWREVQDKAHRVPDAAWLARFYKDLRAVTDQEGHSIYTTSSLIALGAVRTGIKMGNLHIFDYYRTALDTISADGLPQYIKRISDPYRRAAAYHLDPRNPTYTQRTLGRLRIIRRPGKDDSLTEC